MTPTPSPSHPHRWTVSRAGLVLAAALAVGCGGGGAGDPARDPAGDTTPDGAADPAPSPPPVPAPDTRPDTSPDTVGWAVGDRAGGEEVGPTATLTAVRVARHDGYDRFVLELEGRVPAYQVGYPSGELRQCGSGRPIPVSAPATLRVLLRGAVAHDEAGAVTVADRDRTPGLPALRSARLTCDYEAHVEWVLGVAGARPYRLRVLEGPPRLVIDVRHP